MDGRQHAATEEAGTVVGQVRPCRADGQRGAGVVAPVNQQGRARAVALGEQAVLHTRHGS